MGRTLTVSIIERVDGVESSHSSVTMDVDKDGCTVEEFASVLKCAVDGSWSDERESILACALVYCVGEHSNYYEPVKQDVFNKHVASTGAREVGLHALDFYATFAPIGYKCDLADCHVVSPFTSEYLEARLRNEPVGADEHRAPSWIRKPPTTDRKG